MEYNKAVKLNQEIRDKVRGLIPTGSIVRHHDIINDFDFLTRRSIYDIVNDFKSKIACVNIERMGTKKLTLNIGNYYKINIWHVPSKELMPFFKLEYDMGKANIKYKMIARKHGMKLSTNGLWKGTIITKSKFYN